MSKRLGFMAFGISMRILPSDADLLVCSGQVMVPGMTGRFPVLLALDSTSVGQFPKVSGESLI